MYTVEKRRRTTRWTNKAKFKINNEETYHRNEEIKILQPCKRTVEKKK
jgi:hypothetical protein